MPQLSNHANDRSIDRNLSQEDIDFIVKYGHREKRAGVIFRQLRRKDIPDDKQIQRQYERLIGATVVLCKCNDRIITMYRDERAFKKDQQKKKYNLHKTCCTECPRRNAA